MAADYCPLCGAHRLEQGEGDCEDILAWEELITELYNKLTQVKERSQFENDPNL